MWDRIVKFNYAIVLRHNISSEITSSNVIHDTVSAAVETFRTLIYWQTEREPEAAMGADKERRREMKPIREMQINIQIWIDRLRLRRTNESLLLIFSGPHSSHSIMTADKWRLWIALPGKREKRRKINQFIVVIRTPKQKCIFEMFEKVANGVRFEDANEMWILCLIRFLPRLGVLCLFTEADWCCVCCAIDGKAAINLKLRRRT